MTALTSCQYCKEAAPCSCPGEPVPATKSELEEAITNLAQTASRIPRHWADRKKVIHDRINELLTLRELTE